MAVPRYSISVMYVVREGYSNQAMNHLVKQAVVFNMDGFKHGAQEASA